VPKLLKNVVIEPFTTIHNNVIIGDGTWIGSNVTIMEGARIGKIVIYSLVQLFRQFLRI
jgi:UDP-N-acetylglucosamine acyltransferase